MAKRKLPPIQLPPLGKPASDPIGDAFGREINQAQASRQGKVTQTFEEFFKENPPAANYLWGTHTQFLAAKLQAVVEKLERGESSHIIVNVPPRHGKSDQISRRFPVFCLLRNPDWEVMLGTAASDLSETLARNARGCFEHNSAKYGLAFSRDQNQVCDWGIEGHKGSMYSLGLGGGSAGHGANVLIIDDYYRNREEAESESVRRRVWESFKADFMTRLAPVHAVIVVATCWHPEDLTMSILDEMKADPLYPQFERVVFPAQDDAGKYLFTERFPPEWYEAQHKLVGDYGWQALYMCDPQPRSGQLLKAERCRIIPRELLPKGLLFARAWDVASTVQQRTKDDPDWTVGCKVAIKDNVLYVADVTRGRWEATKRNQIMLETAQADGRSVPVIVEGVAGYKDCYTTVRDLLAKLGIMVRKSIPDGDKFTRAMGFETFF